MVVNDDSSIGSKNRNVSDGKLLPWCYLQKWIKSIIGPNGLNSAGGVYKMRFVKMISLTFCISLLWCEKLAQRETLFLETVRRLRFNIHHHWTW